MLRNPFGKNGPPASTNPPGADDACPREGAVRVLGRFKGVKGAKEAA